MVRQLLTKDSILKLFKKYWWFGFLGVVWLVFFVFGAISLDPDFGWHYQIGKYIVENKKVPEVDLFSYTMPSFEHVDHEWLISVLFFLGYEKIGMWFLASVFALFVVGTIVVVILREKRVFGIVPIILSTAIFFVRGGVRPQVLGWLFAALLLRFVLDEGLLKKWRWVLPFSMALWANLHGSFALGIVIIFLAFAGRTIQTRRIDFINILIFVMSILGTLINPYGWKAWYEVWTTMSDSNLRFGIAEWQPFYTRPEFGFLFLIVFLVMVLVKYWSEFSLSYKLILSLGLVMGVSSLRHVALFAVISVPIITKGLELVWSMIVKIGLDAPRRGKICGIILVFLSSVILAWEVLWAGFGITSSNLYYPIKAVEYLKTKETGNVFSDYGWGGYLVWKFPEKKVFIDGRMPSWRTHKLVPLSNLFPIKTNTGINENESEWAFKDYIDIIENANIEPYFSKYKIDTVLWHSNEKESWFAQAVKETFDKLGVKQKEKNTSFIGEIKRMGWKKVYEDETAVIYRKN